jgi:hypothetical protein
MQRRFSLLLGCKIEQLPWDRVGDWIAGPGGVRCDVAGVVIPPLPVLMFAVSAPAQLGIGTAIRAHTANQVPPEMKVDNALRRRAIGHGQELFVEDVCGRRTIDAEWEILTCRGGC